MTSTNARLHRSWRIASAVVGFVALFVSAWVASLMPVEFGLWIVPVQLLIALGIIGVMTVWLNPRQQ